MATAAQVDNPEVIAARFNEHAAAARVRETMGRFLPQPGPGSLGEPAFVHEPH